LKQYNHKQEYQKMAHVIETHKLTKRYGNKTVLDSLNIAVNKGEVLGYLGPNGAGKTTTIRLLLGLTKATSGSATIFGENVTADAATLHKRIAYIPGETSFWPGLTGAETLRLLANLHGVIDEKYQKELIKKFDFDVHKKVRSYSKGNRQKIALIAALSTRAELLIFDEPTSGLDPVMSKIFRDEVLAAKHTGQTVFLSSHILEEVEELCDRVAVLRKGKLVELGSLEELRHLSAVTVEATFRGAPPDISKVKSVSNIEVHDHFLRCNVHGPIDELLAVISNAKPLSFLSRKPSLEELFLAIYETGEKAQ
jgi:ABC-2 type transport system ATP-binding protein